MRGALVGWWVPRPSLALALLLGLGPSVLGCPSECRRRARSGVIPTTFRRPCFCGKRKCVLLFASDGAGLALLGASVDPIAFASGMRGTRQGRSQVMALFLRKKKMCAAFRVRRCWLGLAWCFRRPDGNCFGHAGRSARS